MKKLMIALTAVATAFGLYAADSGFVSGAAFDSTDTANPAAGVYTWLNGNFNTGYWSGTGAASLVSGDCGHDDTDRPAQFANDPNRTRDGYIKIATTLGTPVTQSIRESGDSYLLTDAGLYFDGLVNFTVFDADDTIPAADLNGAKIGVYLQLAGENESDGTNFVVVAKSTTGATAEEYVCSVEGVDLAGWHRLTIKAIKSITGADGGDVGFVVFVDGEKAECTDAKLTTTLSPQAADYNAVGALFVSLGGSSTAFTSVSFDGQGEIDDIAFTTTAPFNAAADGDVSVDGVKMSFADAVIAINGAESGDKVLKLYKNNGDAQAVESVQLRGDVTLTIDLYGQKLIADVEGAVTITDTTTSKAGTLDGKVSGGREGQITVLAGAIKATEDNVLDMVNWKPDDGKYLKVDNGYIVLDNQVAITDATIANVSAFYGTAIDDLTITYGGDPLVKDTDYELDFGGYTATTPADTVVTVTVNGIGKFTGSTTKEFTVAKLPIAAPTIGTTQFTYDGNEKSIITLDGTEAYTVVDNAKTDAGDYTAVFTLRDAANTTWVAPFTGSVEWSITPAKATVVTAPVASGEIEKEAQLSTITLVNGVGNPAAGTFVWVNPTQTVSADGNFKAVFKPTDSKNYTDSDEFDVAVKVKSAAPVPQPTDLPEGEKTAYNAWLNNPEKACPQGEKILTDPADVKAAYLLDCPMSEESLEAARKEFKFDSIAFENDVWVATIKNAKGEGKKFYGNGEITLTRYSDVECKTPADNGNFFKATLGYKN